MARPRKVQSAETATSEIGAPIRKRRQRSDAGRPRSTAKGKWTSSKAARTSALTVAGTRRKRAVVAAGESNQQFEQLIDAFPRMLRAFREAHDPTPLPTSAQYINGNSDRLERIENMLERLCETAGISAPATQLRSTGTGD